jgi:hypothetical protein
MIGTRLRFFSYTALFLSIYFSTIFTSNFSKINATHIMLVIFLTIVIFLRNVNIKFNKRQTIFIFWVLLSSIMTVTSGNSLITSTERILILVANIVFFCYFVDYFVKNKSEYLKFVRFIFYIIVFSAVIQILSLKYGIELIRYENSRFRSYDGVGQLTGIFKEPRFFATFIFSLLFHFLILDKRWVFALILSTLLYMTHSVTGIISFAMVIIFFAQFEKKIGYLFIVFVILILYMYYEINTLYAGARLSSFIDNVNIYLELNDYHSISHTAKIGHKFQSSVYYSTIGEWLFLKKVVLESAITGFGIGYDKIMHMRTMSLNGITEITYRFGLIGLFIFFYTLKQYVKYKTLKVRFVFYMAICFVLLQTGSIGKLEFWFVIAILVVSSSFISTKKVL